ncbi:MAG: hypothetical protein IJM14_10140 [Lachnospiraceae bacterium]|nr:hypothetical protein [Lachnospiraceae bacterium]
MFWDKISPLYDLFENVYNGNVYTGTDITNIKCNDARFDKVVDGRMPCAIAVITKSASRF